MNKKKIFTFSIIIIVIIFLFIIFGQGYLPFSGQENNNIQAGTNPGDQAPDFTLNSLYGKEIKLSGLQGKKVFLNFWATWCGPCRSEMPDIEKLNENHENIEILAINIREEKGQVLEFVMKNGYTFPIALDRNGKIANKYQARGIPTTYILDENGIVMEKHTGVLDYSKMKELLKINK